MQNAAVLPVPVWAEPKISRWFNISGIALTWICVGLTNCILAKDVYKSLWSFSSWNVCKKINSVDG